MLKIAGLQKLTLLDYPGKTACTVFLRGCNFQCEFCQNSDLVFFNSYNPEDTDVESFLTYLRNRKDLLDAVCISGGEPTMHTNGGLKDLIKEIKKLDLLVKLDTNGSKPQDIEELLSEDLLDYIAMDIKTALNKIRYSKLCHPISTNTVSNCIKSIDIIKNSGINYEFRTTVIKEFHTEEDFLDIAARVDRCQKYSLQNFKDSDKILNKDIEMHPPSTEVMNKYKTILEDVSDSVVIK